MARADEIDRAIELANEGRFQEARQLIAPLLDQQPDNLRARLLQGILHVRDGRLDDAVRLFEALRDSYPGRSEPYNNLATVYVAQGRLDDAHAALLSAIARRPELPAAHENLADLYIRLARRSSLRARTLASAPDPSDRVPDGAPGTVAPRPALQPSAREIEVTETVPSTVCFRTATFVEAAAATDAAAWLEQRGTTVVLRQVRDEVVRDHWVFHGPLPSRAEAVAMVEEMRASGVEDIAIIRHGDLANGISLGIYRSTDNMERRVAALEAMGYSVQYETTLETVTTYGLEAEFTQFPAFMRADWAARFPEHPLEPFDCG
jgi:tetratricopeptide (TPR) repeat protein